MYQRKLERDIRCPLEYGLDIFSRKWNSRIICVLAAKKSSALQRTEKRNRKYNRCSSCRLAKGAYFK